MEKDYNNEINEERNSEDYDTYYNHYTYPDETTITIIISKPKRKE